MGADSQASGHHHNNGAEAGLGGLHSRPGCQGKLQGAADKEGGSVERQCWRVVLTEGDDGRLGHLVPPVCGPQSGGGGVQVRGRLGGGGGLAGQG